jgi:hypothetical protein
VTVEARAIADRDYSNDEYLRAALAETPGRTLRLELRPA